VALVFQLTAKSRRDFFNLQDLPEATMVLKSGDSKSDSLLNVLSLNMVLRQEWIDTVSRKARYRPRERT